METITMAAAISFAMKEMAHKNCDKLLEVLFQKRSQLSNIAESSFMLSFMRKWSTGQQLLTYGSDDLS